MVHTTTFTSDSSYIYGFYQPPRENVFNTVTVDDEGTWSSCSNIANVIPCYLTYKDSKWEYVAGSLGDLGLGDLKVYRSIQFRSTLKQKIYPEVRHRNQTAADFCDVKENEIVALQLLKSMLSPERWKKYLKYGFVDVLGKSGLIYQIIRGQTHVRVFRQGEKIADLCVGLANRSAMPPTDEVITRMIIVECDEPDIWQRANVYGRYRGTSKPKDDSDLLKLRLEEAA
jgi:hypothetical protein